MRVALGLGLDALQAEGLDPLVEVPGGVGGDAGLEGDLLADGAAGRLLDPAPVEGLERELAPDELLLEHRPERPRRSSVLGPQGDAVLAAARCSEPVPLKSKRVAISRAAWSTALRTSWRVDLGHHVEAGHGADAIVGRLPRVGVRVAKGSRL